MTKNNRVGAVPPNKSAFIGNDNISLRDYFAGLVMQKLLESGIYNIKFKIDADKVASLSYSMSKRMLEAKDANP